MSGENHAPQDAAGLLAVDGVSVRFGRGAHAVRAVDGVSLHVNRGEIVGLVGESGCGKSTLARAILGLEPLASGSIRIEGREVVDHLRDDRIQFRRLAQMVFQDPYGSLNPRLSVGAALEEVLRVHRIGAAVDVPAQVMELLRLVGLDPTYAARYPHEFSGGQRQRIGIARALAVGPELLIADEPVSALDVSVQVQILNLLKDLQAQRQLTLLFIAHDLAAVRYLCDRIYVMYLGRVVESGPAAEVYAHPAHPYTEDLLAAVPDVERGLAQRAVPRAPDAEADVSYAVARSGCAFSPRCPRATARCRAETPALRDLTAGQRSACHYAEDVLAGTVAPR